MNDGDSITAGDPTSASATIPQNKKSPSDPIESVQMMPPNIQQPQQQQQQPQTGGSETNVSPSIQWEPQSDNQFNAPSINATPQRQQQVFISEQQNLVSGQATANLPSSIPQQQQQEKHKPPIKPLLEDDPKSETKVEMVPSQQFKQDSPQKTTITKVKLSDELNIFDWLRTTDIINQIAEKAKSSVGSVITTLDPGMKEYLYSGGNVNIVVLSDSQRFVSPIRESFQDVFGRATVVPVRHSSPNKTIDYPLRTACGFMEAALLAEEKTKKLRLDTSSIPQNQVVVVVQPALVSVDDEQRATNTDIKTERDGGSKWFLTYCMMIEDPILGVTMKSYSQLVPMDQDVVEMARTSGYPDTFQDRHLGFSVSIDELMASKLRLSLEEMVGDEHGCLWLPRWAGIYETQVIRELSLTLANAYRRKWSECATIETVS